MKFLTSNSPLDSLCSHLPSPPHTKSTHQYQLPCCASSLTLLVGFLFPPFVILSLWIKHLSYIQWSQQNEVLWEEHKGILIWRQQEDREWVKPEYVFPHWPQEIYFSGPKSIGQSSHGSQGADNAKLNRTGTSDMLPVYSTRVSRSDPLV